MGIDGGCDTLSSAVASDKIDLLLLNAGIFANDTLDNLDFDAMRNMFDVNALGPLRVVNALRSKLSEGSKIVLIGSKMGSIGSYGNNSSRVCSHPVVFTSQNQIKYLQDTFVHGKIRCV